MKPLSEDATRSCRGPSRTRGRVLVAQAAIASALFGLWSGCGLETSGVGPGSGGGSRDATTERAPPDGGSERSDDTGLPDGEPPDGGPDADAGAPPCRLEVDGGDGGGGDGGGGDGAVTAAFQRFDGVMNGCAGRVLWADRANLCNESAGCTPCTAAEWIARRGDAAPTHQYWTDDELRYLGPEVTCNATLEATAALCPGMPFRVCIDGDSGIDGGPGLSIDMNNNRCNWTRCGYRDASAAPDAGDAAMQNLHFGGCSNNPTAGTLCCCK